MPEQLVLTFEPLLLNPGFLYLLDDGDAIKIGHTYTNVISRRDQLRTGNPRFLTVVLVVKMDQPERLEELYKARYRLYRAEGGTEWFRLSPGERQQLLDELNARGERVHARYDDYSYTFGGATAFDIRPLRRRQQYPDPTVREGVSERIESFDAASDKHLLYARRGKYEIRLPPVLWEERAHDRAGHRRVY
jgi:hypothetical protein